MNYIEKIHEELLDIMDFVDKLCQVNGIQYYLIGGSLLGAVRHKGFIPWDDDLDIAMPRKDFLNFINIMTNGELCNYRLEWITSNKNYYLPYAKVEKSNTAFQDKNLFESNYNQGINIDIFPLDEVACLSLKVKIRKRLIARITAIRYYKIVSFKNAPLKKIIVMALGGVFSQKKLSEIQVNLMTKDNAKGYSYIANYGSNYAIEKQTFPKSIYGKGKKIVFENCLFNVPDRENEVLCNLYGESYMQLPPKTKRIIHNPVFVQFSDGEKIKFE